ncbi:hypothetical protein IV73_GL000319 [Weissella kandleri]|uniref:UPF0145 protein IV73_GL000319 n=1 Tax=Weissella kandleri TaxID=1616 RepID=A0A0R2JLX8_9LACO|nr:heavy metal-binding domain-containing protein [Weissella kandleri]KRN75820.1 hypothetical protein IV73_GL000319 [Weissella kandleri]
MNEIKIVTTENVAGYSVTETLGEVFGLTTRSRNIFSSIGQGLKTIVGGEIKGYSTLQELARQEAITRLRQQAAMLGADAVIMFRFDSSSSNIGDSVTAYGTAVRLAKI